MNRAHDWWKQAQGEAGVARYLLQGGHFAWCCFVCHQAAEKAFKGVLERHLQAAWGHDLDTLIEAMPQVVAVADEIREAASRLNKHYIPPRYVDVFPSGAPVEKYTAGEAAQAISDMEKILAFAQQHIRPAAP